MKKKTSRFIALLTLVLVAALLASCSVATPTPSNAPTKEPSPTPVVLEEVTIKILLPGTATNNEDVVWENVSAISKEALNSKFDVKHIPWGDYVDKVKLLIAGGDDYDMSFDAFWFGFPTLLRNGSLLELNDLMDQYAPNLKKDLQDSGALPWAETAGKIMAVPNTVVQLYRSYAIVREDLRLKYGIGEDFSTLEKCETYIDTILKNEKDIIYPSSDLFKGMTYRDNLAAPLMQKYSLSFVPGADNYGLLIDLNDPTCKVFPHESHQWYKEFVETKRSWYEKGWLPKNAVNEDGSGKAIHDGVTALSTRGFEEQYLPVKKGEIKAYDLYPDSKAVLMNPMVNAMVFNVNAANPERAMMFLEWMNVSQENYDAVMIGIKDKTYTFKAEKEEGMDVVTYMPGEDSTNGYIATHGRWGLWRMKWERPNDANLGAKYIKYAPAAFSSNPNNIVNPLAGFSFDPEPVKTELAKRAALMDDLGKILDYGLTADVDQKLEAYKTAMKEAGEDVILAEVQKQVDAFLKSK
jgi:putative aldouronate transport system substrate-binding protein